MQAANPIFAPLTQEAGITSINSYQVQYKYVAPPTSPNYTAWQYAATTSTGGIAYFSSEAAAVAFETNVIAAQQASMCPSVSMSPAGDWTSRSSPPPAWGSSDDFRVYTVNGQGYAANPTPHCVQITSSYDFNRQRTISCPTNYSQSSTAPYCFDSMYNYIVGHPFECHVSAAPGTSTQVGNPCDVASGEKFQTEVDYSGPELQFIRYYHSGTLESHHGLGVGWTHNFAAYLVLSGGQPSGLLRPDGHHDPLSSIGGQYVSQSGASIHVQQTGANWTAFLADGSQEVYDSSGRLIQLISSAGEATTLNYANGVLSSVVDPYGHSLQFGYANGLLTQVTDPAGQVINYTYDPNNNLASVTYPDATGKTYLYENSSFPNNLTGIIDEAGVRYATYGYDSIGRAISSQHAGGADAISINYGTGTATVGDGIGGTTTFSFTNQTYYDQRPVSIAYGSNVRSYVVPSPSTDVQQRATSMTDANGAVTIYSYDRDHLTSKTEAYGTPRARTTSYQYLAVTSALPTVITEPLRQTTYAYYSGTNLIQTKTLTDTSVTPNVSRTWSYTYDGNGRIVSVTGPRTDVVSKTTYAYYTCTTGYQCGQLETVTDAAGQTTTYNAYNAHGQPLTITDPNGVATTLTYDARLRLTSRSVSGETTSFSYYPTGLLETVTLADGSSLTYKYDQAHRLTEIDDGPGNRELFTLDAMGNRIAENVYDASNALARTHTRVINTLNQISEEVGSAGTSAVTTVFGYDGDGNQVSINAPLSRNTTNAYDELGRLTQITDPANGITNFGYDAEDDLASVTDPRNFTTGYSYDGFGDLTRQASPDTGTTANTYDSGGNLSTSTDARGAVTTYSYDALNRVTSIAYTLSGTTDQAIQFAYDTGTNGIGHLTGAADANDSLGWSYDGLGRVISESQTVGNITKSVAYTYTNGDLTQLVTPSGQTVVYTYANHRITGITVDGTTLLSSVLYEPFGPTSGWTWGNSTNEVRSYDEDGNLVTLASAEHFTYSYDNAFRVTGITDNDNGVLNQTFGYDALDRLTSATGATVSESWTYDGNGNRVAQGGSAPSTYNVSSTSNQITGITGTLTRTYSYAPSGQTLGNGSLTYTYWNSGRLASVTNGGATTTYLYNALGQRIEKSGPGGTEVFVYDEAGHLLGEYDGSGNLIQETVWMGDIPVATLQPNGSSGINVFYVHTDHLNTPRRITRPGDNAMMWRWDSDPFGATEPNTNPSGQGAFAYNLALPGQYYDAESGTMYNYHRDYDPSVGRYVESDPTGLGAGINTYAYVDSSPVLFFDPDGLGKEGGQTNIGGNDPAMPRSVTPNSPPEVKKAAVENAERILKEAGINAERARKIRGWIKVLSRKAPKGLCVPPLLEDLAIGTARQLCEAGDQNMCQVFQMLGGEIEGPIT